MSWVESDSFAQAAIDGLGCPSCMEKVSIGPIRVEGNTWHCIATCGACEKRFSLYGRLLAVGVEEI